MKYAIWPKAQQFARYCSMGKSSRYRLYKWLQFERARSDGRPLRTHASYKEAEETPVTTLMYRRWEARIRWPCGRHLPGVAAYIAGAPKPH